MAGFDLGGFVRGVIRSAAKDPQVRDWARERLTPSTTGNYVGRRWTDRDGVIGDAARGANSLFGGVLEGSGVGVSFTSPTTGTGVSHTPGSPYPGTVVPSWALLALVVIGVVYFIKRRS